ncbi:MAG TPA: crotonyl-CoA carboxylase/reductase [Actinomycetota bacterium]|nr:crotonyl-CoA carboxylase/reductase [Actinomycetota bacterium]
MSIDQIRSAIEAGDFAGAASVPLPESIRAAFVRKDEQEIFDGLDHVDKDPRKSLHVGDVPLPPVGPNEALVAIMASAINYNTVWTSIFEPIPTFRFLERFGKESELGRRHDLDHHIVGSDGSGVVLKVGSGVTRWKPGDLVTVHCNYVDMEAPEGHDDSMLDPSQKIWGFETNFGGLAEIAMVKANQLMSKPRHLTWEEAACNGLVNSTAYRMLVSQNGTNMKQGDVVLIWGATGGLGGYAIQYCLNGGAIPVAVVSSPEKVALLASLGVERVIDRSAEGYEFWMDGQQQPKEWMRFGKKIRELTGGEDPDIVFEHPGRQTFGASVFVTKRGGKIVTCASTSGFTHEYDNRYLWMHLKSIIGSHFANYREATEANRLLDLGMIQPILSRVFPLAEVAQAAYDVHTNAHVGKLGILCLAGAEGQGVQDDSKREALGTKVTAWKSLS